MGEISVQSCVYIILIIIFLNYIILGIYCRIMKLIDQKRGIMASQKNEAEEKKAVQLQFNKVTYLKQKVKLFSEHYMYGWMRYSIIQCGKIPSNRIRKLLYRYVYVMNITKNTVISANCEFRSPWNIEADRCIIMSNCLLDARNGIRISEDVVFGVGVHIWTEEHDVNDPLFAVNPWNKGCVEIGHHAWICSDSSILPNIKIGEGTVIASRACVTKDCQSFGIYGGVPAKKIGSRNENLKYKLNGKPHWHFY